MHSLWSIVLAVLALISISSLGHFTNSDEGQNQPHCERLAETGVALSFDDSKNIEAWNDSRVLFIENGVRATFYIDHFDRLNESEVGVLLALQSDGHEIGVHTMNHTGYLTHLDAGGTAEEYVQREVLPEMILMKGAGIGTESFAYPSGERDGEIDRLVLEHFDVVRGVRGDDQSIQPWLTDCEDGGVFRAISIPDGNGNQELVTDRITGMAGSGSTLVVYAHDIDGDYPDYSTSSEYLEMMSEQVNEEGIPWLTMSQLGES